MATMALPSEQIVAWRRSQRCKKIINRLAGLFGDLEFDRPTGLALSDCRVVDGVAVWGNVCHPEANHVAAAQLAVDRKIEQCQISSPSGDLKSRSDGPDVLRLERRFCPG